MNPRKPVRLSRKVIYENPWLDLYVDEVRFPAGRLVNHHVVYFKRESVTSLVEDRGGKILLVRSYRYITDSLEWELPGGGAEKGESVVEASKREVLEESGYKTTGHKKVYTFHPVNGLSNKIFHVVFCKAAGWTGKFDRNEVKELKWFTKARIKSMIERNQIRDGYSLVGLLLYFWKNS